MNAVPPKWEWVVEEGAPRMLMEGMELYGVKEQSGTGSNPEILSWSKELGFWPEVYSNDAVPWCGLYVAICASRASWDVPGGPLWARNWQNWGEKRVGPALLGDVLVFPRGKGGHVGMYVGETKSSYAVLGGNQSDMVNIVMKSKTPILAVRHAPWRVAQPENVRRVFISSTGVPIAGKEV